MTTVDDTATATPELPRITQWVEALERRRPQVTDPDRLAELDLLVEHLVAEEVRDLPRTLATVSPRGRYHSWGGSQSYTATTAEQAEIYASALTASPHTFDLTLEVERFLSGPDGICMDGTLHKQCTYDEAVAHGYALPEGAQPGEPLVVSRRLALFVSFLDGLLAGEDMYRDDHAVVLTAAAWAAQREDHA